MLSCTLATLSLCHFTLPLFFTPLLSSSCSHNERITMSSLIRRPSELLSIWILICDARASISYGSYDSIQSSESWKIVELKCEKLRAVAPFNHCRRLLLDSFYDYNSLHSKMTVLSVTDFFST